MTVGMHGADVDLRLASLRLVSFGIFFVMGCTNVKLIAHARTVVLADNFHLEMVIAILPGSFHFTPRIVVDILLSITNVGSYFFGHKVKRRPIFVLHCVICVQKVY